MVYAEWCETCHKQIETIQELEKQYSGHFTVFWINEKDNDFFIRDYQIKSFPTMLIITNAISNGVVIQNRLVGYFDAVELKNIVSQYES